MAAKDTEEKKSEDQEADLSLDMSQSAVKKMIADARERGYITYDQLNNVLPYYQNLISRKNLFSLKVRDN